MNLKVRIDQDLKQAMLAGDKVLATTLRGLKSTILNAEIAGGKREEGLADEEVISVLQKEAKRRQESADLYEKGGNSERAEAELKEKSVIEQYLPVQMQEDELVAVIDEVINSTNATGMQAMGQVIGQVKQKVGSQADGSTIARLVKEKLS